ncbi:uncharacterized protein LOC111259275 [Varroa jacobsoni]|uniref:uncharacterized protein LOC111259275 n=1 Tax=Varroa jacobsoni TaxID=62625 RepID=UPI000BF35DAA|nr:uncharacterized protein LOC111259275 [Varroa jacobsoni]
MLFEKLGLAFLAGWLLNHQNASIHPQQLRYAVGKKMLLPRAIFPQILPPKEMSENIDLDVTNLLWPPKLTCGCFPSALPKIYDRATQTQQVEADEKEPIGSSSPFLPPPLPFVNDRKEEYTEVASTEMQERVNSNYESPSNLADELQEIEQLNQETFHSKDAKQAQPQVKSPWEPLAQRDRSQYRLKKKKQRKEPPKDRTLVLTAPNSFSSLKPEDTSPSYVQVDDPVDVGASTLIYGYMLPQLPYARQYQYHHEDQRQQPLPEYSIVEPVNAEALADPATLGAMVMSSDVYLDRYKFPPLVQPVPEGENNYFRKRTSQSNSNGIIAGHTQDNVSHRKAFNLKLFHLPLISIDLDSKVYKDESLVADIGKRNG